MSAPVLQDVLADKNAIDYRKLKALSEQCGESCGAVLSSVRKGDKRGILAVYGNCQVHVYARLIKSSKKLMAAYLLLWFGPVQEIHGREEREGLDKELVEQIDVLIYQEVVGRSWLSSALNTKDIVRNMRKGAMAVCIPNIYFDGYFPQHCGNMYDVFYINEKGIQRPCFPYGDKNIEKFAGGVLRRGDYATDLRIGFLSQGGMRACG